MRGNGGRGAGAAQENEVRAVLPRLQAHRLRTPQPHVLALNVHPQTPCPRTTKIAPTLSQQHCLTPTTHHAHQTPVSTHPPTYIWPLTSLPPPHTHTHTP